MRRAVLNCVILALLSPRYAEAAERIWRVGVLTPGLAAALTASSAVAN
jgi:hypothetical protein